MPGTGMPYARGTQCPVLKSRMLLPECPSLSTLDLRANGIGPGPDLYLATHPVRPDLYLVCLVPHPEMYLATHTLRPEAYLAVHGRHARNFV